MTPWTERPTEVANLLNPAYCGFLLYTAVKSYEQEAGQGMPYALCVLVLPIVLHKVTRESLPRSVTSTLLAWVEQNQSVIVDFAPRVRNVMPFTREAITFASTYDLLRATNGGTLQTGTARTRPATQLINQSEEVKNCIAKSQFLGKWFAQSGDTVTIYQSFGIQP